MLQEKLSLMEKRSQRTNKLASKSKDRRADWIGHTLEAIESDVKAGGNRQLSQARTIAKAFYYGSQPDRQQELKSP